MALILSSLTDLAAAAFDMVIDARSPAEYGDDHLPGAVNLPVLDDQERAHVGTIYKQQSPFLARKVGAALVARNAAHHLESALVEMGGGWRPLVYCWRGGQRSGSFTSILTQVGWRAEVLQGGYKAWRTLVVQELSDTPVRAPVIVLDGNTGTAKTDLLASLARRGVQVIDLEGLANHRGSLFGHRAGGQPSQKAFEGRLALLLATLDPGRPVVIEAESSRIGARTLPKQLWAAMGGAPRIHIAAPLPARAAYLTRAYGDLIEDPARLAAIVESLRAAHPADRIEAWGGLVAAGQYQMLAQSLMEHHYDRRYEKHRARFSRTNDQTLSSETLDEAAIEALAAQIEALVAAQAR